MRDDFPKAVKRDLAHRVGFFCSNPDCQAPTAGPSYDSPNAKSNVGTAAHITGASPNGPRFDPNLTAGERKSFDNGLWLCRNCGTAVDVDTSTHTVQQLRQWKGEAEQRAKDKLGLATSRNPSPVIKRNPLHQQIACLMRDAIVWTSAPISFYASSLDEETSEILSKLLSDPPKDINDAKGQIEKLKAILASPKIFEMDRRHPNQTWAQSIETGLLATVSQCEDVIRKYSGRAPDSLLAGMESLRKAAANQIHAFTASNKTDLLTNPDTDFLGTILRTMLRAQFVWRDFLREWEQLPA